MLSVETSALLADLDKFHKEATRKMKGMVRDFSSIVTSTAIDNTPQGNSDTSANWYNKRLTDPRNQSYGLQPIEGFARGSWRVDTDGSLEVQELYTNTAGSMAMSIADSSLNDYKLGDTVMISNYGPYIRSLEKNYSGQTHGQGIMQPTLDSISRTYQLHLDDYYNRN